MQCVIWGQILDGVGWGERRKQGREEMGRGMSLLGENRLEQTWQALGILAGSRWLIWRELKEQNCLQSCGQGTGIKKMGKAPSSPSQQHLEAHHHPRRGKRSNFHTPGEGSPGGKGRGRCCGFKEGGGKYPLLSQPRQWVRIGQGVEVSPLG